MSMSVCLYEWKRGMEKEVKETIVENPHKTEAGDASLRTPYSSVVGTR